MAVPSLHEFNEAAVTAFEHTLVAMAKAGSPYGGQGRVADHQPPPTVGLEGVGPVEPPYRVGVVIIGFRPGADVGRVMHEIAQVIERAHVAAGGKPGFTSFHREGTLDTPPSPN